MQIKLIRHGESLANIRAADPSRTGDHAVAPSPRGHEQARAAGGLLGAEFLTSSLVYSSPYRRTRETLAGLLEGAGVDGDTVRVFEDPRLREVDPGYVDRDTQLELRRTHGWFYYRFHGGESPADCYDRTCTFLESLMRQVARKRAERVAVVTHGLAIRCFVMRFLHLTVEQFDSLGNPFNCDIVTIAHKELLAAPVFTSGKWGVEGIRFREPETPADGGAPGVTPSP